MPDVTILEAGLAGRDGRARMFGKVVVDASRQGDAGPLRTEHSAEIVFSNPLYLSGTSPNRSALTEA